MPTQCSADLFGFAPVEGRRVEAGFDGGTITSDAGALLLGATDRVVDLVGRLAGCFVDARRPDLIEHDVATLIGHDLAEARRGPSLRRGLLREGRYGKPHQGDAGRSVRGSDLGRHHAGEP